MSGPAPIPVYRPSYLTDGVEFQGSLTESPANVFYQSVNASIASLNRMQYQWRSVSDQLLVSPVMMLRFKIAVPAAVDTAHQLLQRARFTNREAQRCSARSCNRPECIGQIGVPALGRPDQRGILDQPNFQRYEPLA